MLDRVVSLFIIGILCFFEVLFSGLELSSKAGCDQASLMIDAAIRDEFDRPGPERVCEPQYVRGKLI